ncbi:glycine oxidase ThiO [Zhihengliuella salsuginis]|uniref:glycine oxidase n=1 Tax=Zhihengliuella salsuginis TaxID=578222 RepID=A0ABQ3GGV2_9MICC|nr:glycine oxidase ThiO [Zhihengliuella salsuginis]GHD05754.1 glycine oxidase ThiO [Zhihengliuella salsuginis]
MAHAIVAGAGIVGLATAFELTSRGWDVTICDPAPASGASHAAAGMLAPAAEMIWGQGPLFGLMIASGRMYRGFLERLSTGGEHAQGADRGADTDARDFGVGYLRTGTVVVGADAADRTALEDLVALQRAAGLPVEAVTSRQLRKLEPALAPSIAGGVHLPEDHQVDPRRLTAALIARLEADPRAEFVRSRVTALTTTGGATTGVELDDGRRLAADQTVVATGLGAADLLDLPLRPIHGDILRLRLPERNRPLITRIVRAIVNGRPVYAVPRVDGTVVLGATSREDSEPGVSTEGVHDLLESARRILPGVLDSTLLETTARARPGTPDDVPLIGRLDPGLIVSTGYSRHGILLAPLGSRLTAKIVAEPAPADHDDGATDPAAPTPAELLASVHPDRFTPSAPTRPAGTAGPTTTRSST